MNAKQLFINDNGVDRPMTDEETTEYWRMESLREQAEAELARIESAKTQAKSAAVNKLKALGLTDDEINALVGA